MQTSEIYSYPRFRWVDLCRAIAIFLVVLAHVNYKGPGLSWIPISYYALTRVAVPLFFMVSGHLLLSKNEPILDFLRKRALKVFVPFLIWSVIYLVWKQEAFGQSLTSMIKIYLIKILRGPRENHLWFFYELFGLYLFTPILRIYVQKASAKDMLYFLGIWFTLVPVVLLIQEFTPIKIGFSYQFLEWYIGYYIAGYFFGRIDFRRGQKAISLVVFLSCLIMTGTSMYLAGINGLKTQYFEDYLSVNVVVMSISLYICLINIPLPESYYPAVRLVSRASFGIYLAHVIVMKEIFSIKSFSWFASSGSAYYMIPLMGGIGLILSLVLTIMMQRIPIVKFAVP